jgi:heme/copper-type cytochrome/quinol oxidase subunit 2
VAPPKTGGGLHFSRTEIIAIVLVAIIAFGGLAYFSVYNKPSTAYFGETITIQIYGAIVNSTTNIPGSYAYDNFTAYKGEHVVLKVWNTDNVTHGLAIPKYNLDTGPLQPNATATLAFVPNQVGNFTWDEPSTDCGGGSCDTGPNWAMTGTFQVLA